VQWGQRDLTMTKQKQGVSHRGLANYILKSIFCQKKKLLWKLKYFTMQKYSQSSKKSSKKKPKSFKILL